MSSMDVANLTKEKLEEMFKQGKRFDNRDLFDYRELKIETGISNQAEGSARVCIGNTDVMVGVKLGLGEPYPDSPDKGNLTVSADLLPLASPRYESGPPRFPSIELPRLVDRSLRESGMIDFSKLVITKGEKVWTIFVDIYPINDGGNVIDAATIAAIIAMKTAVFPGLKEDGNVDYKNRTDKKLPISDETLPISFTFYKLGNTILLDPTREEEESCDVRITLGISRYNKQYMVNSAQKTGETALSEEEINKMLEILPKKFDEMDKKIKKLIKI